MCLVRIVCEDTVARRNLLKGANKLKAAQGYNKIYVAPDLTKSQQITDNKLREQQVRAEHRDAKINNGEIVILENGQRRVLFSQQS